MQNLHIYLNDHLAGSVGALELLDHLIEASSDSGFAAFLVALRDEINADQTVLRNLLRQIDGKESTIRKAGAWLMEKLSRSKLQADAEDNGLGLFQALEALTLGINGKRALWRSLAAAAETVTELRAVDYARMEKRAAEQFERVEARCLQLAPAVLKPS